MASCKVVSLLIIVGCINMISSMDEIEGPDHQLVESIERPVGRAYSIYTCNYRMQPGYTCLSCHRALHCYPGNVALLVDCYGLFRYCRDGRCSRFEGDKCPDDNRATTTLPLPATFNETIAESHIAEVSTEKPMEKPIKVTEEPNDKPSSQNELSSEASLPTSEKKTATASPKI